MNLMVIYECHNQSRLVTHQSKLNNNKTYVKFSTPREQKKKKFVRKKVEILFYLKICSCRMRLCKLLFNYAICDLFHSIVRFVLAFGLSDKTNEQLKQQQN